MAAVWWHLALCVAMAEGIALDSEVFRKEGREFRREGRKTGVDAEKRASVLTERVEVERVDAERRASTLMERVEVERVDAERRASTLMERGLAKRVDAEKRASTLMERRRAALMAGVARYEQAIERRANQSKGPLLMAPHVSKPTADHPSLLGVDAISAISTRSDFQPSAEFESMGESGQGSELPWGIGSPRAGDNWPVHEWSSMNLLDVPKWVEYSLETGDNIQTFSSAWQDVKLITQVFENVTNGFYLDTNGGDGETNSYTLLMELTGWRGLILEPQVYQFANLWGKMRKAWLFLGCVSPTSNATKIGFDSDGVIDMGSGHRIHAYNLATFMEELGGRKSIDFWALRNGHYEAEVLQETLFNSGKNIEFGVILVRFDGRNTGRGFEPYVLPRSKEATEDLIMEIFFNASYTYIGGLDAYWVNYVEPRFHYLDHVWVNPVYFERRGLPVPTVIKSAPPPPLKYPRPDHINGVNGLPVLQPWLGSGVNQHPNQKYGSPTDKKAGPIPLGYGTPGIPYLPTSGGGKWDPEWLWDAGYNYEEETTRMIKYMAKARADAASMEAPAKAHRVSYTRLTSVEGR